MKTIIMCTLFAVLHLSFTSLPDLKDGDNESIPSESSWIKSEAGSWLGNYNVWYKMDKKSNTIKVSYNNKKWKPANGEVVWLDSHGHWLFIGGDKLMCSENGKNWSEVKNRTWQDMNGTWYRFDKDWTLWEVKL